MTTSPQPASERPVSQYPASQYPVNLVVAGRPVLVVGAGKVASGKVAGLLDGGADDVTVVAPRVERAMEELAEGHAAVRIERRPYASPEATRYALVLAATDDPVVTAQVFADADAAGVWVNAADDPANCTFTLPARVRRGDLLVTVSTGGHSPALASWLRRRFEAELGPEYDVAVRMLSAERESLKAAGRSTEGLDWSAALDAGLVEMLRDNQLDRARELLRTCLSSSSE